MGKKSKTQKVKDKFKNYEIRIDKLKSLERELKVLNPIGYKTEIKLIKSKLKDPYAIDEVEKMINNLRKKMLKHKKHKSPLKKIQKNISQIKNHEIPKIGNQIRKIQEAHEKEHRKHLIKIQNEVKRLKSNLEKNSKIKDNSEVRFFVDSRYKEFIDSLKDDLSQEEHKNEEELKNKLQQKFLDKERDLGLKYEAKIKELKDKYDEKVNKELNKEIASRFNNQLNSRLIIEKARIEHAFALAEKKKLDEDLERQRKELMIVLQNEFDINFKKKVSEKMKSLDEDKKRYHDFLQREYSHKLEEDLHRKEIDLRRKFHSQMVSEVEKRVNDQKMMIKQNYDIELKKNLENKKKEFDKMVQERKDEINRRLNSKIKQIEDYRKKVDNMIREKDNEIKKKKEELKRKSESLMDKNEIRNIEIDRIRKDLETQREILRNQEISLEEKKAIIGNEFMKKKKSLEDSYNMLKKKEEAKFESEKHRMRNQLLLSYRSDLKNKIDLEIKNVKKKLHHEFMQKLHNAIEEERQKSIKKTEDYLKQFENEIFELNNKVKEKDKLLKDTHQKMIKKLEQEKKEFEKLKEGLSNKSSTEKKKLLVDLFKSKEVTKSLEREIKQKDKIINDLKEDYEKKLNEQKSKIEGQEKSKLKNFGLVLKRRFENKNNQDKASLRKEISSNYLKKIKEKEDLLRLDHQKMIKKLEQEKKEFEKLKEGLSNKSSTEKKKLLVDLFKSKEVTKSLEREIKQKDKIINDLKEDYERKIKLEKSQFNKKQQEKFNKINERFNEDLKKKLNEREKLIKEKIKKEFESKMKQEVKKQNAELAKKKIEIESEIRSKVANLLK